MPRAGSGLEPFTPGQAERVEAMQKRYEEAMANQKATINRLLDHLKFHCQNFQVKPKSECNFHKRPSAGSGPAE